MMGNKKRFPSGDYYGDSDSSDDEIREITPPSKLEDSKHIAPESSTMSMSRKKRKATQANYLGLSPKMIWSESDELRILKVSTLFILLIATGFVFLTWIVFWLLVCFNSL